MEKGDVHEAAQEIEGLHTDVGAAFPDQVEGDIDGRDGRSAGSLTVRFIAFLLFNFQRLL
jgi:hypothetical protein